MYRIPSQNELLSQGDIIKRRCVFPYTQSLTEEYLVVRPELENPVLESHLPDAWKGQGIETVILHAYSSEYAIILSNSCDAENVLGGKEPLELVLVGAVLPLASMLEKNARNCRSRKLIRYHPLSAHPDTNFPELFVHFGLSALIRQEALVNAKNLRALTLESPFREDLGHRYGEFVSRIALP